MLLSSRPVLGKQLESRQSIVPKAVEPVASLIETDPETAESVVEDLSELFRASLNEAGSQVQLKDELNLCERYVRIEALRLGERLNMQWEYVV